MWGGAAKFFFYPAVQRVLIFSCCVRIQLARDILDGKKIAS